VSIVLRSVVRLRVLCLCVLSLLLGLAVQPASASITLDANSQQAAGQGVTSLTWTHTLGTGTNRMIVCGVTLAYFDAAMAPVTPTVTFDGVPATAVNGGQAPTHAESSTSKISTQLFYIQDAALGSRTAGTYNVNVSFSPPVTGGASAGCTSLFGVNQAAPEAVTTAYSGSATFAFPSITTITPGAWVIDSFGGGFGSSTATWTPNSPRVQLYNAILTGGFSTAGTINGTTKAGQIGASSYELVATPGSITPGWTSSTGANTNSRTAYAAASFAPAATTNYTVTTAVSPANAGTVTLSPNSASYSSGTSVQATATPATNYVFTGWSGDLTGSTNPATFTVDANKSITANFAVATCSLTINVVGSGTVTPTSASQACGTPVTLTATPTNGYSFAGFSGGYTGSTSPATFNLNANLTVTATFVAGATCTLTTSVTGSGSINLNPAGGSYSCGTSVVVTANPATSDYIFTGFGGALSGTTNPQTIVLNANSAVSATFQQTSFPVNVTIVGPGTVTTSPSASSYASGTDVQLTATPNSGAYFVGFTGDLTSAASQANVTVNATTNITATFANLQITKDAVSHSAITAASKTLTWNHVLGNGSSRAVVIAVSSIDGAASPDANAVVTSVTFNGVYATPIPNSLIFGGTSGMVQAQLFYLLDSELPAAGTYPVQVNLTGSIGGITAGAISLFGVNQGPPEAVATHKDTSGADLISTPITTLTNNAWVIDAVTNNNSVAMVPNSGQTLAWTQFGSLGTGASSTVDVTSAGPVTLGWAGSASRLVHSLAAFPPASSVVPPTYSLTTTVGAGGGGTVTSNPNLSAYPVNTGVLLTAVPATGYAFTSWTGDFPSTVNPLPITMDTNHSVTANFVAVPMCSYTVNVTGNGTVTPATGSYPCGSTLTLTGTPAANYGFTSWSGDFSSADNPAFFTLTADSTVTAEFDPVPLCNFTANVSGTGTMTPATGAYACGSVLTLNATAASGWAFNGFSGDYSGTANPAQIILSQDMSVTANFTQGAACTLTTSVTGSGSIVPSSGTYACGTTISISALPQARWLFNNWGGDLTGTTTPTTITLDRSKNVTASFVVDPSGVTGDARTVAEPVIPPVCSVLTAAMSVSSPVETMPDTARVVAALSACPAGQAVQFSANGSNNAFVIAPITLPAGVTMLLDPEVTILGSIKYADYNCNTSESWCSPLINVATNIDPAPGSGIMGYGVIDGRGGVALTDKGKSWWGTGSDTRPRLIYLGNRSTNSHADNFTMYKVTLRNSPKFNVSGIGDNETLWDVKILAPPDSPNTDGFDPSGSKNITLTQSYISNGDDMVAVKAGVAHVSNVTVSYSHFYSGHGVSIGSETNAGLNNMFVHDIAMDNGFGGTSANSLRIKSDVSRGGEVYDVLYQNVCLLHGGDAIVLDPYYSSKTGTLIPNFHDITFRNVHLLIRDSGSKSTMTGYNTAGVVYPLTVTMDNVFFDGYTSNDFKAPDNFHDVQFTLGPNTVNFAPALQTIANVPSNNITVTNLISNAATAYDCTNAFVYLSGELMTPTPAATVGGSVTLTAILQNLPQPTVAGATTTPQQKAPTGTINILEGGNVVGYGTLNGRLAYVNISQLTQGTHTYTANYTGDTNFPAGLSFGTVQVVVNSTTNTPPVAAAQTVNVPYNTPTAVTLSASGTGALVYSVVTQPANGILTGTAPSLTYTPNPGYTGTDSFTFKANNGADSNIATVTISVSAAITPAPVASSQTDSVPFNTPTALTLSATGSGAITYTVVAQPAHGALSGTAPNIVYTPTPGYSGPDSFTFKANNGTDSNIATVNLTVTAAAPVATPQNVSVPFNTATPVTLTATGGGTITFSVISNPAHGLLTGTLPNLIYTPTSGYTGADSFTFKANNGTDSNVATVSLTVVAAAPVASVQTVTVPYNTATPVTLSATGTGSLTYSVVASPAHGTLNGTAPNLTYTPNAGYTGADSFTFKANNGTDSNIATVSVTVLAAAPVASAQNVNVSNSTATPITLSATGAGTFTYSVVTQPTHGTLTGTAPSLTYTPTAGYAGADSFTFKANNGTNSNVATISITVLAAPPIASAQTVTVVYNTATAVTLSAAGTGTLTYSVVASPTHGTLTGTAPNLTYTPTSGYAGTDTFTFKANNGVDSNTATVSLTVNGDLTWGTGSGGAMTATVSAGQTATYVLQIAGWTGATGSISFTCSGAPQYSTCTITPNPATLNGTTAIPVTVTVTTQSTTAALHNSPAPRSHSNLPLATMAGLLGCFVGLRRFKGKRSWTILASCLALAIAFTLSGCGSSAPTTTPGTASGTYALNVTGTFGSTAKTVPLTLVIH
jgi:uncharacterized repeat protein (TIGR02543 family)